MKSAAEALRALIAAVRGGDKTAGVTMDDALMDADEVLAKLDFQAEISRKHMENEP